MFKYSFFTILLTLPVLSHALEESQKIADFREIFNSLTPDEKIAELEKTIFFTDLEITGIHISISRLDHQFNKDGRYSEKFMRLHYEGYIQKKYSKYLKDTLAKIRKKQKVENWLRS